MTLSVAAVSPGLARLGRLARHPAAPAMVLAGLAWLVFAWVAWGSAAGLAGAIGVGGHHGTGGDPAWTGWTGGPAVGPAASWGPVPAAASGAWVAAGLWALMVVAMMLPTTAPALRYVAQSSRRTWRPAMTAAFVAAYLGAWMLLAPVAAAAHAFAPASPLLPLAALLVAAAWELTPWKRRALRHCHRTMPVRFSGVAAVASVLRFGMRNGLACAAACAPAMLAIAIAGHPLLATVAIAGLLTGEKLLARGEQLRPWIAATLLVAAALVVM